MALLNKKSGTIHNKTGSELNKIKSLYDNNTIGLVVDEPENHPHIAALIYQLELLQQDVDELRRFTGVEQKSKLDTLTVGTNQTISFVMSENRGSYTLTITLTDTTGGRNVVKRGTIILR